MVKQNTLVMKKVLSAVLMTLFCGFSIVSLAQENLKSSKILYDKGLDEIYDVQPISNGYLALGHKGDEATTKKLWLIKFDKQLNVVGSKIIYNQALVSPFRLQPMANGNVLVLAQDVSKDVQSSILFCLHPEGAISWSKRFAGTANIELSDLLVTADQSIYLYGAKRHILNASPYNDQALIIKLDKNANQLWQKEIAMGDVELRTKQMLLDKNNNLILTGTMTSVEAQNREQLTSRASSTFEEISFTNTSANSNKVTTIVNDTAYVEDPFTGELEIIITKKKQLSADEKMQMLVDKLNARKNATYVAELKLNKETGEKEMNLIQRKNITKLTVKDTSYVEDPISGKLSMIISDKIVDHKFERVTKTNLEGDRQKTNGNINFYAIKISVDGEVLNQTAVNRYADYSLSNAVVENEKGYLFLLQSANYFGDGMLLQTDKNLKTISEKNITGTPILFSGLFKQKDQYVVGGIFSNTLNDYSPGFILLDNNLKVQKAKSSESLFTNFFISNIAELENNSFMLSGIGYENNQPSDVYFLPFTADGKSACNLTNYNLKMENVKDIKEYEFEGTLKSTNATLANITDAQFALADESKFTAGNICTTPDENPVAKKENGSWNQWNNKNADAFTMKIPTDWLQVSPNPSSGEFTVQYNGMQNDYGLKVFVTDITGKLIYSQFIQNQDTFKLNLSKYAAGIYNLKIDDGVKSLTRKIELLK